MTTTINNAQNVNIYNNTFILSKVCIKCNQIKPLTDFNKDKSKSDGLHYICKSSQSIISKHYRDNYKQINANKIFNKNDVKVCWKCKLNKPLTDYQKNITNLDGLGYICNQCEFIKEKRYRYNNKQIYANRIYTENDLKTCYKWKQQKLYT